MYKKKMADCIKVGASLSLVQKAHVTMPWIQTPLWYTPHPKRYLATEGEDITSQEIE